MRVLITGASGQLGSALTSEFRDAGHQVHAYPRAALDVTCRSAIQLAFWRVRPDVVLNCSAYNQVDAAETNVRAAYAVNAEAVALIAEEACRERAVLVHFSTDFVFDGETDTPYGEADDARPRNVYGLSKLAGEGAAALAPRHYVLRLASLFGRVDGASSTIDWVIGCVARGARASLFVDRVVSPTYTVDAARATRLLLECHAPAGLYHAVNSGHVTWYELALEIARQLEVQPHILAARRQDVQTAAARPRFCALSNAKLVAAGVQMPRWDAAIARHLALRRLVGPHPLPPRAVAQTPICGRGGSRATAVAD